MKIDSVDKLVCIKAGFFCIILFFWVTGIVLICLGASVQTQLSDISLVITETSAGAPMVLAIVGMVIIFLSGFGALAAIKENNILIKTDKNLSSASFGEVGGKKGTKYQRYLYTRDIPRFTVSTFTGVMLLVFVVEILVGISAYSYRDKLQNNVLQRFVKLLNKYGTDKQVTRVVDGVQEEFQCCGANNFTDWFNTSSSNSVPPSCCRIIQQKCGEDALGNVEKLHPEGCVVKMKKWISEHINVIGAAGVGLGISQILGILFSCLLAKILQKKYVSM
ncbi:CD63 antigen-like isoform X1 [Pseudophryne corroboree]|uniref:CD63 antigen-like isoform X1 n=1 Tax=Pseudophryne corroboree TaxID=495146 RepID=UPI003081C883